MNKIKKCCFFTGKSQFSEKINSVKLKEVLAKEICRLIKTENVYIFSSDMSLAFGLPAAEAVLELKKKYPYIALECVQPFETQANNWKSDLRERYFRTIENCDSAVIMQPKYSSGYKKKQFDFMFKEASHVIYLYDKIHNPIMNTMINDKEITLIPFKEISLSENRAV